MKKPSTAENPYQRPLDARQILDDSKLHVRLLLNESSFNPDNGVEAALRPQVRCWFLYLYQH